MPKINIDAEVISVNIANKKVNKVDRKVTKVVLGAWRIDEKINDVVNTEMKMNIEGVVLPVLVKKLTIGTKRVDKHLTSRYYKLELDYNGVDDNLGRFVMQEVDVELT